MRLGVIVARFQVSDLHNGQKMLVDKVLSENNKVLIVLGESPARLTYKNPLSFEIRKQMVEHLYGPLKKIVIAKLTDHKSDSVWSEKLDKIIKSTEPHEKEVTIYCGRDGFAKSYSGKFKTQEVSFGIDNVSATEQRKLIHGQIKNNAEWREGVVFSSEHRYPVSFQTVDIAIIDRHSKKLLLGQKSGETKYRFVGGFVDPKDESLELAAKREVIEECSDIETDAYKYIGSFRVDDWRYRKEKDKIMTALFTCDYIFGSAAPRDDISALKWFPLKDLSIDIIEPEHIPLMNALINHLKQNP